MNVAGLELFHGENAAPEIATSLPQIHTKKLSNTHMAMFDRPSELNHEKTQKASKNNEHLSITFNLSAGSVLHFFPYGFSNYYHRDSGGIKILQSTTISYKHLL